MFGFVSIHVDEGRMRVPVKRGKDLSCFIDKRWDCEQEEVGGAGALVGDHVGNL